MKPAWTFAPGGAIWRVHPAVAGRIVGEERDLERRRVTFFALDFPSGAPVWKGLGVAEEWWTGIERVEGELLFIHGFVSPDLPMHRGITVVDIPGGAILWSKPLWTLDSVAGDRVTVLGDQRSGQGMMVVDARTGDLLEEMQSDPSSIGQDRSSHGDDPQWWQTVAFPGSASVEELSAHRVAAPLFTRWDAGKIVGEVEMLDRTPLLIAAAAVRRNGLRGETIEHALLIVNQSKAKVVHDVVLARNARGAVMDAFFVQEGMLVYVVEGHMLCAVRLADA
ncbi:MAG: hypothetical protein H6Q31_894 [Bacteroidetes bacterium]|nr:hypothetical protein [Bacteroidota bacterium]